MIIKKVNKKPFWQIKYKLLAHSILFIPNEYASTQVFDWSIFTEFVCHLSV